jgi:hypothetical protein
MKLIQEKIMKVELAKENADGSAVFTFDMTPEETRMMVLYGIQCALEAAIKDAETWDGDKDLQGLQQGN